MPSKKQYDLVTEDCGDSLIPLHSEEAFKVGICFHVKFIGSQEVPRPTSRVEIVAAMRRVRYEFKARLIKKNSVDLTVSTDGVKVSLRDGKKSKKYGIFAKSPPTVLLFYPIYRIFYVSHDSQDMLIFSFIARDATSNTFKCNVFKASKKAMTIVRTIGQAFDVCHRLSMTSSQRPEAADCVTKVVDTSETPPCPVNHEAAEADKTTGDHNDNQVQEGSSSKHEPEEAVYQTIGDTQPGDTGDTVQLTPVTRDRFSYTGHQSNGAVSSVISSPHSVFTPAASHLSPDYDNCHLPLTSQHHWQLMRQQVDQQEQQARSALADVTLLSSQLASETAARVEAQNRVQQLLRQNRELLEHINSLVGQLHQLETKMAAVPLHHHVTSTQQPNVSMATVRPLPPNASPSRQQLSLALKHTTWSSSANGKPAVGGLADTRNIMIDNGPSSDLGSSGPGSVNSHSPGDRLDQFLVTPSPLSDTIASPEYKTATASLTPATAVTVTDSYMLVNGHGSIPTTTTAQGRATTDHIPKIEPPPKSRKSKSNRPSPLTDTPTSTTSSPDDVIAHNNNYNTNHYNNGVYKLNTNTNNKMLDHKDTPVSVTVSDTWMKATH